MQDHGISSHGPTSTNPWSWVFLWPKVIMSRPRFYFIFSDVFAWAQYIKVDLFYLYTKINKDQITFSWKTNLDKCSIGATVMSLTIINSSSLTSISDIITDLWVLITVQNSTFVFKGKNSRHNPIFSPRLS